MQSNRFETIKLACSVTVLTLLACYVPEANGATETTPTARQDWKLNADCQFYEPPAPLILANGLTAGDGSPATCSPTLMLDLDLPSEHLAFRDSIIDGATEFYVYHGQSIMWQYHIDSLLNVIYDTVPIFGGAWVAADLDLDGEVEVVTQIADRLQIFSAPDWRFRSGFVFPGRNVVMYATATNVDADPYLEIFLTPNDLGGNSSAVLIDYEPVCDSFVVLANIPAPIGTVGRSAIGDFDNDGQIEFIVGNDLGYGLFEWSNSTLVYVGSVGSPGEGNSFCASAVRPGPCGELRPLLGYSSALTGIFHYELLEAVDDNVFGLVHSFEKQTGYVGIHPNAGADVDCDGLDELAMAFPPYQEIWGWDNATSQFVQKCDNIYGPYTIAEWYPVDLDRDGVEEWGASTYHAHFHDWVQAPCENCDPTGHCYPTAPCGCEHHSDPSNDDVRSDIVDVVMSIGVAFRGAPELLDSAPCCPSATTDLDCNGETDVIDVVKMIDIAFRNGDVQSTLCSPCK